MNLSDAWINILDLEGSEQFNQNQVYSILADLEVFKETPKIKLVVKIALENGLWNLINSQPSEIQVLDLRLKLQNEGFANDVIDTIIDSFYTIADTQKDQQNNSSNTIDCEKQSNIRNNCDVLKKIFGKDVKKYHPNDSTDFNNLLYHVPALNQDNDITIHTLNCSIKTNQEIRELSRGSIYFPLYGSNEQVICLEYDISNNFETNKSSNSPETLRFVAFVISRDSRIHSKTYITSIKKTDKYAISKGACKINNSLPFEEIAAIIIIPENGDLDINSDYSHQSDIEFKRFCRKIEVESFNNKGFNDIDIHISNIQVWGSKNRCSIGFEATGETSFKTGWKIGKQLTIAWFNRDNRLIETSKIFIGKTGYVGPRGGLHDTWMYKGCINLLFFKYIELSVDIENVSKILISDQ